MENIDERIKELKRKRQNIYSLEWKRRNSEYCKIRDNLHTKIHNRKKAIPILQKKIEKYQQEIKQFEKEVKKISRYRVEGQQRRRHSNGERLENKVKKG